MWRLVASCQLPLRLADVPRGTDAGLEAIGSNFGVLREDPIRQRRLKLFELLSPCILLRAIVHSRLSGMQLLPPLPPGAILSDYIVQKTLGQGGFGTTYLGEDKYLQKQFVVKEFTPHHLVARLPDGKLAVRRSIDMREFSRQRAAYIGEAQALAKFTHPNIARAVRYFEANNTAYLVMEYEVGRNLRAYMHDRCGELTDHELEAIARPLCAGLQQLHTAGLIHRDLKPDNVLIRDDGGPVLLDFGAVIPFREAIDVVFTPGYAPPEQLSSTYGNQGAWTDVYALGATLYELIEGVPPPDVRVRLAKGDTVSVFPTRGVGRHASKILNLVEQCLALVCENRPQTMQQVLSILRSDDEELLGTILKDTSLKLVVHFLNSAKPNRDLYLDEFAAFAVAFPAIDLSWRIGDSIPVKEVFQRLLDASHLGAAALDVCAALLKEKGFSTVRSRVGKDICVARMPEYSAAYLLDRQQENWTYPLLLQQLVRTCLAPSASQADKDGFRDLMEDVVERARGRVQREHYKQTSSVAWSLMKDGSGWEKRLRKVRTVPG